MFRKFWQNKTQNAPRVLEEPAAERAPAAPVAIADSQQPHVPAIHLDFGFTEREEGMNHRRQLANYDRLGQTLVGTPLVDALSGPDAGALANELCEKIQAACQDPDIPGGVRHVVLDLQNVQYMDSMCVGVLVELLTELKRAGGRIALANASSNIECLFKLTRLDRVFPICRDVMKAIDIVEREEE